jgi:N-acetylmuramoyl-L-alanine amidase
MPLSFFKNLRSPEKNRIFIQFPLWTLAIFACFFLFSVGILFYHFVAEKPSSNMTSKNQPNGISIVLDAGHGGEDPGKVGVGNQLEKEINLAITQKLKTLLENKGFTVYLTRDDDTAPDSKKEDMTSRMDYILKIMPDYIVSIHQNSFTDESVSGPQVFYYSDSSDGKSFAQTMQSEINSYLKPTKPRVAQANNNYYLLKNSPAPIIIVECGFLSNPTEAELLTTDTYQQKIARAIYFGIVAYSETPTKPEDASQ